MSVIAVHLEIVTDLAIIGFFKALKRLIARIGLPNRIFSVNGTFQDAKNELNDLFQFLQSMNVLRLFIALMSSHYTLLWVL